MTLFLTVLHVMVCIVLILVVLVQKGRGAEIGAVFGGGASTTVFGSRGAGNFLTKLTTVSAVVFMVTSLSLSYIANTRATRSIFEEGEAAPPAAEETLPFQEIPAAGGPAAEPGAAESEAAPGAGAEAPAGAEEPGASAAETESGAEAPPAP